jgi:hypothetical protein
MANTNIPGGTPTGVASVAGSSGRPGRSFDWVRMAFVGALGFALVQTTPARGESSRVTRPLTVSFAVNAILPSVGGEVAVQASDRVAFAVQLTQFLWAHVDLSARMRVFVVAEDETGFYVGPTVHAWYSPLIIHGIDPVGTVEVGYERRAYAGSTFGIGLGGGVLWNYRRENEEGGNQEWKPIVLLNLRFGKSY